MHRQATTGYGVRKHHHFIYFLEVHKNVVSLHYLDVFKDRLDKDIQKICKREKLNLILLCEKTRAEILSMFNRRSDKRGDCSPIKLQSKMRKRRRKKNTV